MLQTDNFVLSYLLAAMYEPLPAHIEHNPTRLDLQVEFNLVIHTLRAVIFWCLQADL